MAENNFSIQIYVESRYKLDRKRIKQTVEHVLKQKGITGPTEVSIAIVGSRKMRTLNNTYRNIDKATNVLSFSQMEGEATVMPDSTLILGDVIVCYPVAVEDAARDNMLVDRKISELVEHGLLHLLGEHH
ncbi:MAG TPA: rRNA maturation RNase YbeY [Candidatus Levybacteria bacterium]|nr:rRNA maturation RNase YbeY [Candidatus Levybacteria bacterium]